MQLHAYVTRIQDHLVAAAALGDDRARQVAEVLATSVEPALRLAVLEAVAAAADDITAALLDSPGSPAVSVRFSGADGDELQVDVRHGEIESNEPVSITDDADASARISLRLSDALKAEIETAARAAAISVNTWLVRVAAREVSRPSDRQHQGGRNHHRVTGWVNG